MKSCEISNTLFKSGTRQPYEKKSFLPYLYTLAGVFVYLGVLAKYAA